MSTIPVFIPYVNRIDLLHKAIASVPRRMTTEPVVINNSGQPLDVFGRAAVITPKSPLTFAASQNLMWDMAKKDRVPFYMFLHSDAEAGVDAIEQLWHRAMHESSKGRWGAIFTNYDALAAYSVEAMDAITGWDEEFEWYASDQDCYRRLQLAGYPLLESTLPVKHEPSQTLKCDPDIRRHVDATFKQRCDRYLRKWGGAAGSEVYTIPFNGQAIDKSIG